MDTSSCPPGFASDGVMLYGSDFVPGSCDASLIAFCIVFGAMSLLRIGISIYQFRIWKIREKQLESRTGKKRNRMPMVPLSSACQAVALALFTILASLNVANAQNGGTGVLLSLFYTPMSIAGVVTTMRLVRLGKKLIPLSKKQVVMSGLNTSSSNEKHSGTAPQSSASSRSVDLSQADWFLKLVFTICILSILLMPVSMVIIGPIIPAYFTFQIGAGCLAVQDVLFGVGVAYQYQRLINAVIISGFSNQQGQSGDKIGDADASKQLINAKMASVIRKMRWQQSLFALGGGGASIIWLLNITRAVLPHYWYVVIHYGMEVTFTLFSSISMASTQRRRPAGPRNHQQNSSDVAPTDGPVVPPMTMGHMSSAAFQ